MCPFMVSDALFHNGSLDLLLAAILYTETRAVSVCHGSVSMATMIAQFSFFSAAGQSYEQNHYLGMLIQYWASYANFVGA